MEGKIVIKNKGLQKLSVVFTIVCAALAVAYIVFGFINLKYFSNYPRFYARSALVAVYAVEFALFAHRNIIYMEIGGDFALARRSGALMIVLLCFSAIVEAYYVSVFLDMFGRKRLLAMCVIIAIGFLASLPLVQFQYLNLDMATMLPSAIIGMGAGLVSFCLGFFIIGLRTVRAYGFRSYVELFARALDSFSPIYLVYIPACIILLYMSRIFFIKEMKLNAKLASPSMGGDDEKDENIEDYNENE